MRFYVSPNEQFRTHSPLVDAYILLPQKLFLRCAVVRGRSVEGLFLIAVWCLAASFKCRECWDVLGWIMENVIFTERLAIY